MFVLVSGDFRVPLSPRNNVATTSPRTLEPMLRLYLAGMAACDPAVAHGELGAFIVFEFEDYKGQMRH